MECSALTMEGVDGGVLLAKRPSLKRRQQQRAGSGAGAGEGAMGLGMGLGLGFEPMVFSPSPGQQGMGLQ